jgi:hypothetical protein
MTKADGGGAAAPAAAGGGGAGSAETEPRPRLRPLGSSDIQVPIVCYGTVRSGPMRACGGWGGGGGRLRLPRSSATLGPPALTQPRRAPARPRSRPSQMTLGEQNNEEVRSRGCSERLREAPARQRHCTPAAAPETHAPPSTPPTGPRSPSSCWTTPSAAASTSSTPVSAYPGTSARIKCSPCCRAAELSAPAPAHPPPPPRPCRAAELYPVPPREETSTSTEKILGRWMAARGNRKEVGRGDRCGLAGAGPGRRARSPAAQLAHRPPPPPPLPHPHFPTPTPPPPTPNPMP